MYNETPEHLYCTLAGVCANLKEFHANRVSISTVACVVIVDGIEQMRRSFKQDSLFFG